MFLFSWIHTFAHVANSINQASDLATCHAHTRMSQWHKFLPCIYHRLMMLWRNAVHNRWFCLWTIHHLPCTACFVWMQTKPFSNQKTLTCDPPNCHKTGCLCSPYEILYDTKYDHPNTRIGWWTSETAITGKQKDQCLVCHLTNYQCKLCPEKGQYSCQICLCVAVVLQDE